MADLRRLNGGLGSSLDERIAEARARAEESSGSTNEFGQNFMDRALGAGSAAGYGIMGGVTDLAGTLGSFLGGPFSDDATTLEMFSDEAYRRALPLLREGYEQGAKTASEGAVPMFVFEENQLRDAEAEQAARLEDPNYLGEFAGVLSDDVLPSDINPLEAFGDMEFDIEESLKKAEMLDRSEKMADAERLVGQGIEGPVKGGRGRVIEEMGEREIAVSAEEEAAKALTDGSAADAVISGVQDFKASAGLDDAPVEGESREEALARYQKEFSDATGINISGKPDKSQALMAFGLALMQNKAGKGFNVGKMLSAVGEAGESAQPLLSKAIERANAAKLAAGKYALQQIKAGESAEAAIRSEQQAFQRERLLEREKHNMQMELEALKSSGKPVDLKNVKVDKVINGLEVQRGRGPNGSAFVFAEDALRDSTGALTTINGALSTVDTMIDLATQISNDTSPALGFIKESAQSALVGAGLADAEVVFGPEGVGRRQQIKILQDSIITQFKRMLTQETGNGISKSDVDNIRTMLGDINFLSNPEEAMMRLKEIKALFNSKRTAVRGVLDELQDPSQYATPSEYEKNMELLPTLLAGNTQYSINTSNGQKSIDVSDS